MTFLILDTAISYPGSLQVAADDVCVERVETLFFDAA